MTLLGLIVAIVVVGVLMWLINTYIPMQPPFKTILNVAVTIVLLVWLLDTFGVFGPSILNRPIVIR